MANNKRNNTSSIEAVITSRVMPNDKEVEEVVLGAILLESATYQNVAPFLTRELFYEQKHQYIYDAMASLGAKGWPIDILTVSHELEEQGHMNMNPTEPSLYPAHYDVATLSGKVGSAAHVRFHIDILRKKWVNRKLVELGTRLTMAAHGEEGDIEEEISKVREFLADTPTSDNITTILADETDTDFDEEMKQVPIGIPTSYEFGDDFNSKQLILPGGALSFICAPTSHGKSTFLRNLALEVAMQPEEGRVLYFTFEESKQALWTQFINLYFDVVRTKQGKSGDLHRPTKKYNNGKSIMRYFREGAAAMEKWDTDAKRAFPGIVRDFKERIICLNTPNNTGRLKVINKDLHLNQLVEAINYYTKSMEKQGKKVKAIFLDYIQLLTVENSKDNRKAELVEICNELMHLSVKMKIPFVMAAQLNRDAKSPHLMFNQNLSDASDIEKAANLIICLWSSKHEAQDQGYYSAPPKKDRKGNLKPGKPNPDTQRLERMGFYAGGMKKYGLDPSFTALPESARNKVYMKITKYRGEEVGLDKVFDWNPNTGRILPNYVPEEGELRPQEPSISFDNGQQPSNWPQHTQEPMKDEGIYEAPF